MTEEDKELLLRDLCSRLPYFGLMVQYKGEDFNIIDIGFGRVTLVKPFMSFTSGSPLIEEVKPYLRPMRSMTEKEKRELQSFYPGSFGNQWLDVEKGEIDIFECGSTIKLYLNDSVEIVVWLNANGFDYRGLIEKGLAIAVTKENNPYK